GGPRRGGDNVGRGIAGASLVVVGGVYQPLIGGVGMNGSEQPMLDAERLMQHLDQGGGTVGGAARIADDGAVRSDDVIIDAKHHSGVQSLLGADGHDDPSRTALQMLVQIGDAAKSAAALD